MSLYWKYLSTNTRPLETPTAKAKVSVAFLISVEVDVEAYCIEADCYPEEVIDETQNDLLEWLKQHELVERGVMTVKLDKQGRRDEPR